jgi:putative addiction module antidote
MPKITRVGNSIGVTLPKEALDYLGLQLGDEVEVRARGSLLEVVPVIKRPKLQPKLQKAVDRTIEKFGPALKRLAE